MAAIQPRISVEYKDEATIVAFTDEKILEETDVRALREAVESVVEQAPGSIWCWIFAMFGSCPPPCWAC